MIDEELEKEDIQHIKEVLITYRDYILEFDNDNLCITNILQYIEQLEKENNKLTYARDWYFEHTVNKIVTPEMLHKILRTKYISRDMVENKIAEQWIKCPKNSINEFMINERNNKIEVLQGLLEDEQ